MPATSTIYAPVTKRIACGQLTTAQVNAGYVVLKNESPRRIFIYDGWVRAIGTPGAGTAVTNICEYQCNVTCSSTSVNDTVTINGVVFTAKAATAIASRQFAQITSDTATGDALALCVNDPLWGVPGVRATNAAGLVSFSADSGPSDPMGITVTSSNSTRLAVNTPGSTWVAIAKAGLSDGVITRFGSANATATLMDTTLTTKFPVQIFCPTGDIVTMTALDYVIKYTVL